MTKIKKKCQNKECTNIFFVVPSRASKKYCNKGCYDKHGKNNPKWKGGKMIVGGYVYRYNPKHPLATKMGYVCEHRLVMEKKIGRYLMPTEVVHHRDEDKKNNIISNLELIESTGKHFVEHHLKTRNVKGQFFETK